MAAETLTEQGLGVDIYDAMTSLGRKFLMAGKSGLNITHAEDLDNFLSRYTSPNARLTEIVAAFPPQDVIKWMAGLDILAHTGPTGRVFPQQMKASPLLRNWLTRLQQRGAVLHPRHFWQGWDEDDALKFETPDGPIKAKPAATILALGGASWKRLGSTGEWTTLLADKKIPLVPFQPSNCGFTVNWSDHLKQRFAGAPVKAVRLTVQSPDGPQVTRSEFVITKTGLESGGIYTLSAALRGALTREGPATLMLDLVPDIEIADLIQRLSRPRGKQSLSNHLRKTAGLSAVKLALLHEVTAKETLSDPNRLAEALKALPIKITGTAPIDQAISTTGGVAWSALNDQLMLGTAPGIFCAGEMIDWDAPTGGYLITACLAMGRAAGQGAATWLK